MNKVREIRIKAGLTQNQLAAKTGGKISQGDISKLETGYFSKPQPKVLKTVAEALGVSEAELFPPKKCKSCGLPIATCICQPVENRKGE